MELELNIEDSYAVHPMIIRNKTRDAAENIIQSLDGLSSLTEWDKIRRIEIII